ncbi:hypothetical protein AALA82_17495 [Oscillospiraceae bacterium 50-16]
MDRRTASMHLTVDIRICGGLRCSSRGRCLLHLALGGMDSGCLGCGCPDRAVSDMPASHTHQSALEEPGHPGGAGLARRTSSSGTGPASASPMSAAYDHCDGPHGDHGLGQHGAAGASYIDPHRRHKAVDLLRDLQKGHRTEEPDQYVASDRLLAGCRHRSLYLAFVKGKGWNAQRRNDQHCQKENGQNLFGLFHKFPPVRAKAGLR